jgi:D-alanyl-D-alanine carboxypeptidase
MAFGVGAAGLAALPGAAAATSEQARSPQAARLAALAGQEVAAGAPGVTVRVSDGYGPAIEIARQAAWTKADGTLTVGSRFRMGSNTKTMVATVILQLVAERRLALTDPVAKWLPGLIPDGHAITIRMLLNHTSGLFDYLEDPAVLKAFTGRDTRSWTPLQLIAAAVRHKPLFAPGKEYSYSNTNYVALGLVAQQVTGKSMSELIEQRIDRSLGLKDTYLVTGFPAPGDARVANGYEPDAARLAPLLPPYAPPGTSFTGPARGTWVNTTKINNSTEWTAGGIVSTAADWALCR